MECKYSLYSYDVFDTVITRKTANPHGIFALMQRTLVEDKNYTSIPHTIAANFYELRISAEHLARTFFCKGQVEEISLADIYAAMNTMGVLSQQNIADLICLEKEIEIKNVIGITRNIEEIKKLLDKNERVVFISDMYLDRETVVKMLSKVAPFLEDIPLYLSSELNKTKRTGTLYLEVEKVEEVTRNKWLHKGDNLETDIEMARSMGIVASLFDATKLIPIEKSILKGMEYDVNSQLLVGASKNCRILYTFNSHSVIGSSLGGFLLIPYVRWVIQDVCTRGISSLYFVARDGFVLKEIADILINAFGINIMTKYIYGSRKAWRMPSKAYENIDFNELLNASTPEFITSMEKLADVFELTNEELAMFLPKAVDSSRRLSRLDVDILFMYLSSKSDFVTYVKEKQLQKLNSVKKYIQQEIKFGDEDIAFVEVGGTGYTQRCLTKIIEMDHKNRVISYFFQLYSVKNPHDENLINFYPEALKIKDAIEPLCRALHGQTIAYSESNNGIEPILVGSDGELLADNGYCDYIEGLRNIANVIAKYYPEIFKSEIDYKIIRKVWRYYTEELDQTILDFVGETPFEVTGVGTGVYAPKLTKDDIDAMYGENGDSLFRGASLGMSILRMNDEDKKYFKEKQSSFLASNKAENFDPYLAKIPKDRFAKGSKIVVYGAGKLGQVFWTQLTETDKLTVVGWVDKNYAFIRKTWDSVECVESLCDLKYDIVLIAVLNEKTAISIKRELVEMGVETSKIEWISPQEYVERVS